MDRELLYNKSGIKDETAYKAILRSGGGDRKNEKLRDQQRRDMGSR